MALGTCNFPETRRSVLRGIVLIMPALLARRSMAQTGALVDAPDMEGPDIPDPLLASALRPWTGDLEGMVERGCGQV